jgi:hypothetical protein
LTYLYQKFNFIAISKWLKSQKAVGSRQEKESRRQKAESRRQKAVDGKHQGGKSRQ